MVAQCNRRQPVAHQRGISGKATVSTAGGEDDQVEITRNKGSANADNNKSRRSTTKATDVNVGYPKHETPVKQAANSKESVKPADGKGAESI